jgi:hypothetical protein
LCYAQSQLIKFEENGKCIGVASVVAFSLTATSYYFVENLAVATERANRGISTIFTELLCDELHKIATFIIMVPVNTNVYTAVTAGFKTTFLARKLLQRLTKLTKLSYDAGEYDRTTRQWTFDIGQVYIHKKAEI